MLNAPIFLLDEAVMSLKKIKFVKQCVCVTSDSYTNCKIEIITSYVLLSGYVYKLSYTVQFKCGRVKPITSIVTAKLFIQNLLYILWFSYDP